MRVNGSIWHSFLQTEEEWKARERVLSRTLTELVISHVHTRTSRGLDVGCQKGTLTDELMRRTNLKWYGIDPQINERKLSSTGAELLPGWAHLLPFPDSHFDCLIFANVYEHVLPEMRSASLVEMKRVLTTEGVLIGQLPNPYFPIESHSRLPFLGWLPRRIQLWYWRLTPVSWKHDFFTVTIGELKKRIEDLGFTTIVIRNFNYPVEVIPKSVRWAARLLERLMQVMPWAWQFVFRKM